MTGTSSGAAADAGPRRVWLVACLFGLVSSALLVVIVIVATRPPGSNAPPRPHVAIVGDSITEQGEPTLKKVLAHDWQLSIDGRSGYTVAQQLPAARSLASTDPTQVIVNLGTNDVANGTVDLTQSAADLAEVVALYPSATCIHLVTVNEGIELGGSTLVDRASELNRAMAALAATDPRIDVIDWSAVVAAYEAGDQADGPILVDSVHPSPRGQLALASHYADALSACPAPG